MKSIIGLFATKLLQLFKKHKGVVKYTGKAVDVLMIAMGGCVQAQWIDWDEKVFGYVSNSEVKIG